MFFNDTINRIRLLFRKDKESYYCLHDILGFWPDNIDYYKQALQHKSNARKGEKNSYLDNNERLEFLGDAMLDAIVGDIVYKRFEGKREGFLTNARSKLVQRDTLNQVAKDMGLEKLISSQASSNSHNSYLGGNAFEALVGAIYLDRGYDYAMRFFTDRVLGKYLNLDKMAYKEVNFKSKLIEWSQKNRIEIDFSLVELNQDNQASPFFTTQVVIEGIKAGVGTGYSKKESQQMAAKKTLSLIKKDEKLAADIFRKKGERTAMEEQPVQIIDIDDETLQDGQRKAEPVQQKEPSAELQQKPSAKKAEQAGDEFDLNDISLSSKRLSRTSIIDEAEEKAYSEEG